jgi:hypothetical protein
MTERRPDEDVEGHGRARDDAADEVEGHRRHFFRDPEETATTETVEDDAEGHRMRRLADDEPDDVEGHRKYR